MAEPNRLDRLLKWLGLVAAVLIAFAIYRRLSRANPQLVNGLDEPVIVSVGGTSWEVPARGSVEADAIPGAVRIETRTKDGRVIEATTCTFERVNVHTAQAYNVLGVAPIVARQVTYTNREDTVLGSLLSSRKSSPVTPLAGPSCLRRANVRFPFVPTAESERRPDGLSYFDDFTYTQVLVLDGGWRTTVKGLEAAGESAQAATIAERVMNALAAPARVAPSGG